MAFVHTTERVVFGNKRIVMGTYTNDGGSTGGEIVTGLSQVDQLTMQPKGSSVLANQPVVNESFPLNGGSVTVVNSANEVGTFIAIGR